MIVSEGILDIGIYDGTETLLICGILGFYFKVFDLEDPSDDGEVLKIMIGKILVDGEIFAEVIGFFQ